MRLFLKIYMLFVAMGFAACSDWLDLTPEGQATDEKVFSTGDGFRSVLSGVYKAMSSKDLYGVELQFGVVDCISRQYTWNWTNKPQKMEYLDAYNFNYTSNNLRPVIDRIWLKGFNVIANANNLIQNIKDKPADIFSNGETERRLILGEAYACRALMHFDLLRLFAPAPVNDDGKNYVPYVEVYPNRQPVGIPVKPFLEKVMADLENARNLVADFDTTALGQSLCASGKARFYGELEYGMEGATTPETIDDFLKGRGYHLNYYAITALLARVYQYAGKDEEAFQMAKAVMEFKAHGVGVEYDMFTQDDMYGFIYQDNPESRDGLKVVSNLIFALYNERAYEENSLSTYFMKNPEGLTVGDWFVFDLEGQEIFKNVDGSDELADDYRKYLMFQVDYKDISAKWYCHDDTKKRDNNVTILPVIRSTEMRYIMAEYYARKGNLEEAYRILNDIRANRNLMKPLENEGDYKVFERNLVRDAQREWMSEGQLFYLYKRLNFSVKMSDKETRPMNRSEYMLPIPDNQSM